MTQHNDPVTEAQRTRAVALYADLVAAAAQHGITPDDLGYVVNLVGVCLDVVKLTDRRKDTTP